MSVPLDELRAIVRSEREARGLTLDAVVSQIDITDTTWSNFENGNTGLTPKVRRAVAAAFGWSTRWPEEGRPERVETEPVSPPDDDVRSRLESLEQAVLDLRTQLTEIQEQRVEQAATYNDLLEDHGHRIAALEDRAG